MSEVELPEDMTADSGQFLYEICTKRHTVRVARRFNLVQILEMLGGSQWPCNLRRATLRRQIRMPS